ncbi:E3 ubiquitin-protein ligase MBR2-like [Prosopis cineraria]|uniref:E3 ubiquitin-protein ligase MBR2-like n=1 Tax=Prosopis cineraria TaxID=364024 RepID=UPI00240EF079|nr:E3 ubiquitin-protein ligase MBR2-like [Prosopis cineraria]
MPVVSDASATAEQIKWRRPRSHFGHLIQEADPNPAIPSIIQSTRCKSTISSLLLSTFSNNASNESIQGNGINIGGSGSGRGKKKNNFSAAATFRGLGCSAGASQQVSVPAVIRTSADWQGKKARKKKHKRNSAKTCPGVLDGSGSANCVDFQDVWCGPGLGFSADAAASVDCVVARRNVSARGKIDVERMTHRERVSYLGRRTVNPETISFLDNDPDIFPTRPPAPDSYGTSRYYRPVRHPSSEGFAEIMMLQGGLLMGGIIDSHDQFRDWRLDVDNMSYEQLLELEEKIGYVNTGLKEDEIGCHIRKVQYPFLSESLKHHINKKCSICQEEYEGDDEVGKLNCEHNYHFECIRQWLAQKNFCPVCKQEVVVRH